MKKYSTLFLFLIIAILSVNITEKEINAQISSIDVSNGKIIQSLVKK